MKRIPRRTWLLILVGIVLVTVLLLAGSMRNLSFLPGTPMPFQQMAPDIRLGASDETAMDKVASVLRVLFIIGWVLLPFYIIYLIISPEARKRFIRDMIGILPFLLILYFLLREPPPNDGRTPFDERMNNTQLEETVLTPVAPVEFNANPSDWVVTLTTIGLAVAGTALVVGIIWIYLRSRQPKLQPLTRVAQEAQSAIDAIQAGGDLRDVIMRCYFEMNRAIGDSRNLKRNADMTAHEFEAYLLEKGLPREPIHNLTDLFERVRYGAFQPGRQEERVAITSLSAIVSAVQRVSK